MKKLFILGFVFILLVSNVYAWDWDNVKSFEDSGKYGKISVENALGLGGTIAEYELIYNTDECLVECEAIGSVKLYSQDRIFSGAKFFTELNKEVNIKDYTLYIEKEETNIIAQPIYEESCSLSKNDSTKMCNNVLKGYYNESRTKYKWVKYSGEELSAGDYKWKIEGRKDPTQKIDWVISGLGVDFEEWAWWDGSWAYYKQITITPADAEFIANGTTINLTIDTATLIANNKMQEDCDDLRIVFDDTNELNRVFGGYDILSGNGCNNAYTNVYFMTVDNITSANTNYKVYYKNDAASNPPNKADFVFQIYENCSSIGDWSAGISTDGSKCSSSATYANKNFYSLGGTYPAWVYTIDYNSVTNYIINGIVITSNTDPGIVVRNAPENPNFRIHDGDLTHIWATDGATINSGEVTTKRYQNGSYVSYWAGTRLDWDGGEDANNAVNWTSKTQTWGNSGTANFNSILFYPTPTNAPSVTLGAEESSNSAPFYIRYDINSTGIYNLSTDDIQGWYNVQDNESTTLYCDIFWLKNNISQFSFTGVETTNDTQYNINLESENTTIGDAWRYELNCSDGTSETWINSTEIIVLEQIPSIVSYWINSTKPEEPNANSTDENVLGWFKGNDNLYSGLTYNISWLKNDVVQVTYDGISYNNGTIEQIVLNNSNLTVKDNWNFEITICNINNCSGWTNSSKIEILNRNPTIPTLFAPPNDTLTGENSIYLNCSNATDSDAGQTIYYEIYGDTSDPPTSLLVNSTAGYYNYSTGATEEIFYWRCRAHDQIETGDYSDTRMVTLRPIYLFNGTMQYDTTVIEGQTINANITVEMNPLSVIDLPSAKLIYNGTAYNANRILKSNTSSLTEFIFYKDVVIPNAVDDSGTFTGVWNITEQLKSGGYYYNDSYSFQQNVLNTGVFICNGTTNETQFFAFNFTIWDESNNTRITAGYFAGNFLFYLNNISINSTINIDNSSFSEIDICVSPANATFAVDSTIEYWHDEYDRRYYYMVGDEVLNGTTYNIHLYSILSDDSGGVTLYVQDSSTSAVVDAIVKIQRYYPENDTYQQVCMAKTNEVGEDYLYLRQYDTIYKFLVIEDGVLTHTSYPSKITSDSITLTIGATSLQDLIKEYEDISYTLVWNNNTKNAEFTWTSEDSQNLCLRCIKIDADASQNIIYDNCVDTTSGSLTCKLNDTSEYSVIAYGEGNINQILDVLEVIEGQWKEIAYDIGLEGIAYTLLLSGTLAGIGLAMGSAIFAIIGVVLGIIVMSVLGIVKISYATIIGLVIVAIIALMRVIKE